jgi:hypothetical protein
VDKDGLIWIEGQINMSGVVDFRKEASYVKNYDWEVTLLMQRGNSYSYCNGFIGNTREVFTSGHCVYDRLGGKGWADQVKVSLKGPGFTSEFDAYTGGNQICVPNSFAANQGVAFADIARIKFAHEFVNPGSHFIIPQGGNMCPTEVNSYDSQGFQGLRKRTVHQCRRDVDGIHIWADIPGIPGNSGSACRNGQFALGAYKGSNGGSETCSYGDQIWINNGDTGNKCYQF